MNIDTEKLQEAVVSQAVAALVDQFGDSEGEIATQIHSQAKKLVEVRINEEIDRQIKKVIDDGLEKIVFPATNGYGEKKQPDRTLREYIGQKTHAVFTEYLDSNGKPTTEDWYKKPENQRCNRVIGEAIDKAIRKEMEEAVASVHKSINHYLGEYVRTALADAALKLK